MGIEIGPHPSFSWSHSRDRTLDECVRRYYWQSYGSWLGWRHDAAADARLAYRLKQLTSLSGALGQAVHERAREVTTAIRDGEEPPSLDECMERTGAELNRLWRGSKDFDGFLRSPKKSPMLLEIYYHLPVSSDRIASVKAKMKRCLAHLCAWPGWADLRAGGPGAIHLYTPTEPVEYGELTLYAAPDLATRACDGIWEIIDWKTGSMDGAEEQIATYAVYLRERGTLAGFDGIGRGRIVGLDTGEERVVEITPALLEQAEGRIRDSVWRMRQYVIGMDTARNEPQTRDRFAFPVSHDVCGWCPYYELCEPDLQQVRHFGPF